MDRNRPAQFLFIGRSGIVRPHSIPDVVFIDFQPDGISVDSQHIGRL
jgi:hypothetical protein